ncbi:MAG: hypothetical protein RL662_157, partial [Bacteroidota bacterium]
MNKDDVELFGILRKSGEHPKASFIIKLVETGFNYDSICKKLEPLLDGPCKTVGAYQIPDCSKYVLIWASSKIATSVKATVGKEIKTFLKMANKMESAEDIVEVKYKGQNLLTSKSISYSFLMSYVISDVYENNTKKMQGMTDFFEVMSMVLTDLRSGQKDKWSDGMSYRDFFKFLDKRVSKFKSKHLSFKVDFMNKDDMELFGKLKVTSLSPDVAIILVDRKKAQSRTGVKYVHGMIKKHSDLVSIKECRVYQIIGCSE